ncbi:glycoside hydrolase family 95 protein [Sphingobium aromaticiconvertens]|uniref:glycoside hydrolase family 95 protein n=1 Tax=Sphingobium aromaticiconvertens TaxID=365341 RepID=UPI003018A366
MRIDRRDVLRGGLPTIAGLGWPGSRVVAAAPDAAEPLSRSLLWYGQPARVWEEALPVGNGRLGAMIFGGVKRERLQLNEDTLWSGGPYDPVNPRGRASLKQVRALIFARRYAEAEALAAQDIQSLPMRQMSYQSLGDLLIELPLVNETDVTAYRRSLDLDSAIAETRFTAAGQDYIRTVFASHPDQLLAIRMTSDAPFDLSIRLETGQRGTAAIEDGALLLSGVNNQDRGVAGALKFQARAILRADGAPVQADGDALVVRGVRAVEIMLAAATSFRSPGDQSGDPGRLTADRLAAVAVTDHATLRDRHMASHRALFRRVTIDLGDAGKGGRPTDQRVRRGGGQEDPALAALYFQYGRYLMICSSRPGSQPANLQGIWNDSNRPPWGSKYTLNINAEMNYWPVDSAALSECFDPFVTLVEQLAESGRRTARTLYGARGWVAHHNTDLWRASAPVDNVRTGLWPCGGAWLVCQLWDHWDFHRDDAYLARIYPLMRDAALFFVDTLQAEPGTDYLVTNPSNSPENQHPYGSTLCAGPAMDSQILRDLFDRTGDAARRLGRDAALRRAFAQTRARLAPDRIGAAGQLQEWRQDWDMAAPEPQHRHVSHLYALYPGQQIDRDATPDLARAARRTLDLRGDDATGWGLGWRLNLWARLGDGERAHAILARLLAPERTYPNLFDAHPPFQIDGNFGGTAGIIEMLVQSREEVTRLLPALPRAWPSGSIAGIAQRGGVTIELTWREGQVERLTLTARHPIRRRIIAPAGVATVALRAGERRTIGPADFTAA